MPPAQEGRSGQALGAAHLATLDETGATPRLFATALLMLALHRETRRSSRQRKDLFQAAAK